MSKFKEYIIERTMTFEKALTVFGMTALEIADKKELKKRYRKLSMEHHPDRGGSKEMSQDVNDAYAVLSKANTKAASDLDKWKVFDAQSKKMAEQIKQALLSDFQPEIFTRYFNELSGFEFHYEIIGVNKKQWPGFTVEFFTKDRNSVFTFRVSADITDVMRGGLGSGGDISYTVYTEAYGFHMKKKQKMSKSDWGFTRDHSFFKKPEAIFPKKKMKDIFSGKTSKRKFMKRDMITFLKSKLKADWDGEFAKIPLGEDYWLLVYRTTFMRQGAWSINGIYQKKGKYGGSKVSQPKFCTFMEEEQTTEIFATIQKEAMKAKGEAIIKKTEKLITQAYEAYEKSKGM
jgi:curved DNA-binding protein CbpA